MASTCDLIVLAGTEPEVTATFRRRIDGALVLSNPTTVTVRTKSPSGTITEYNSPDAQITNPSTGVWTFTFPGALTEPGKWQVYIAGTAGVIVSGETSISVNATAF